MILVDSLVLLILDCSSSNKTILSHLMHACKHEKHIWTTVSPGSGTPIIAENYLPGISFLAHDSKISSVCHNDEYYGVDHRTSKLA